MKKELLDMFETLNKIQQSSMGHSLYDGCFLLMNTIIRKIDNEYIDKKECDEMIRERAEEIIKLNKIIEELKMETNKY